MTIVEREELVLSLLNHVMPLVRKLARDWHLDFEELYQDASIRLMEIVDAPHEHIRNLPAVAAYCVRQRIINKLRYTKCHQACSLDAPLTPNSDVTYADLLSSPYSVNPESVLLAKERLENLEASLLVLPGRHGIAVRERYETVLAAYC